MGPPPPHVHMFTAEPNQNRKRTLYKKKKKKETVVPKLRERTVQDSNQESLGPDTENHTHPTNKSRHTKLRQKGDVNREQHRSPDKSHGTMGRQRSKPRAIAEGNGPGHNSYNRTA